MCSCCATSADAERAQAIGVALRALANPVRAVPMRAYMKEQFPFLGIAAPARRAAVAALAPWKPGAEALWANASALWALPEREFRYTAIDLLARHVKQLTLDDVPTLLQWAQTDPWWDTVDSLAGVVGDVIRLALPHQPQAQACMDQAACHPSLWVRRVALLHQLGWRQQTDVRRLQTYILCRVDDPEFFIRKAMGWALRDLARTQPETVVAFVQAHRHQLSALTVREATKHMAF